MYIDFLKKIFVENKHKDAIVWKDKLYNYAWLLDRINYWQETLENVDIRMGTVSVMEANFSPNTIALFLALSEHGCVIAPLTNFAESRKSEFIKIAQGEMDFMMDVNDNIDIRRLPYIPKHEFYDRLKKLKHPGLVVFSSGSTGNSKAIVHDLVPLLEKYKLSRHSLRTINFLSFDHLGGINTMLYTLSNAGCIVTVEDRTPDMVLSAIEKYKVELLPTSPTFINLILLSEAYKRYDLSSLKTVTYGTEPMPECTLKRFCELFPNVQLLQTYGLSEVGVLRSKSKSSDSLWFKIGGEGFETRVVNGILQIKAQSSMLGYLNAPDPFTEDGWFDTGDVVEVDGEYIRILGRQSEIINVGGEKVYPAEVESVIQEISNVSEVTVYGEKNPILGNIVCANVSLLEEEDQRSFVLRLKEYCRARLQKFKVPVRVVIVGDKQHNDRYKKVRVM